MSDTDDDDAALFRAAVGPVRPIGGQPGSTILRPRPKPRLRSAHDPLSERLELRRLWQSSLGSIAGGDVASYRHQRLPPHVFHRLKRGQFSIQDELDLHGATRDQAAAMIRVFLAEAHAHGYGCVRIIHGKGQQSSASCPILKNLVDHLLRLRNDVMGFHSAPPAQGGTGAVLILLKS